MTPQKRPRCILCAIALSAVALFACAPGGEAPPAPAPTGGYEEPEAVAPGKVVLAMEDAGFAVESREISAAVNELLEKKGVPLELEIVTRRMHTYNTPDGVVYGLYDMLTAGLGPHADLFLFAYDRAFHEDNARRGYILALDGLIAPESSLYRLNPERVWDESRVDGSIVSFPLLWDYDGIYADQPLLAVRESVLELLGLPFPETPEEYLSLAVAARDHPDDLPASLLAKWKATPPYFLHRADPAWPFIVDPESRFIFYEDGTVEPYIDSEVFERDRLFMSTLWAEGLLFPTGGPPAILFDTDILSYMYPAAGYGGDDGFSVGVLAPEAQNLRYDPSMRYGVYLSARATDSGNAVAMLEQLYTDEEILTRVCYEEDGAPPDKADATMLSGMPELPYRMRLWHNGALRRPIDAQGGPQFPASGFAFVDGGAADSPWAGITFDTVWRLRGGERPIDEIDAARDALREMGLDSLCAELTAQYGEYLDQIGFAAAQSE